MCCKRAVCIGWLPGSLVEEGKNVRAGRKTAVNCWSVISVSGKEYVVEKQVNKRPTDAPTTGDKDRHGMSNIKS